MLLKKKTNRKPQLLTGFKITFKQTLLKIVKLENNFKQL